MAEALAIIDRREEGGGGDGADARDGTQARHARVLDGEVLDRGVGIRELLVVYTGGLVIARDQIAGAA